MVKRNHMGRNFFGHAQWDVINCACPDVNGRRNVLLFFCEGREISTNARLKGDNNVRKKKLY